MDARWPLIRSQETDLARLGGPPLLFQRGQVFQFHSQVASLGIHQDSSGQGNLSLLPQELSKGEF